MKTFLLSLIALVITSAGFSQSGPQLVFENPVLMNGTANQQGAVYRFSNITTGVDAQVKLKKFSRNDIVMPNVDRADIGWSKAFQPEFGLAGTVAPNQNWYIDFELTFYKAGTNSKQIMDTIDFTALDVDGDGVSIVEYIKFDQPYSISYSTLSALSTTSGGLLGQVDDCDQDGISSILITCPFCLGTGLLGGNQDANCEGSGILFSSCGHAYQAAVGTTVSGPVTNFANIDTSSTQVMALYRYLNRDKIKFRYGAQSGALESNGAGIRLNSIWFRQFSLAPVVTLPAKITSFTATLNNKTKVDLKWATASEINVSHFIVERSIDGVIYDDAGMAFAYGSAAENTNYSLTDNIAGIQSGVVYYRLRSIDIDGKSELSETRIIRIGKAGDNSIGIITYPNPATNEVRITIPANWQNKKVAYQLFSANGQPVRSIERANSNQTEVINVSSLAPGLYFVKAICEGQVAQQKIIKH